MHFYICTINRTQETNQYYKQYFYVVFNVKPLHSVMFFLHFPVLYNCPIYRTITLSFLIFSACLIQSDRYSKFPFTTHFYTECSFVIISRFASNSPDPNSFSHTVHCFSQLSTISLRFRIHVLAAAFPPSACCFYTLTGNFPDSGQSNIGNLHSLFAYNSLRILSGLTYTLP